MGFQQILNLTQTRVIYQPQDYKEQVLLNYDNTDGSSDATKADITTLS